MASFFSFFFRQTTELIAYVPLFTETDKFTQATSTNANLLQRVPPFVFYLFYVTYKTGRLQRVPPFNFFKRVPPSDFLIFCNKKYVNESQRVPPFHFLALCDVFEVFSKNFFFKIFFVSSRVGKSDFPVISSMKGTLWVSRKCFQSFS